MGVAVIAAIFAAWEIMQSWSASAWEIMQSWSASAVFSLTTLLLIVYVQIIRPRRRRRKLRRPFHAYFLITSRGRFPLDYVHQDDQEHYVKELVVPPHSEIPIQIALEPKISFLQHELYFGCDEHLVNEDKPRATEWFVPFVREGVRRLGKPGAEHPGHYTDYNGFYHVREKYLYTKDTRVIGFKLLTRACGTYPAQVYTVTDDERGRADLVIRVEHSATTKMRCYMKGHRVRWQQLSKAQRARRCFVTPKLVAVSEPPE
jgi:hypothetical protein